jgi:hypothetical protein
MCLPNDAPAANQSEKWLPTLLGLFAFVFAVLALSAPGRIDIIDGQPRYEVARSLIDHGDVVIRDEQIWYGVLPGRGGTMYSIYRFPQSLLGIPAILLADATGPRSEARRHFFFQLTSPFAGAVLAITYAIWFAGRGYGPKASAAWAALGIFCTPNWWYGTTTFDDILGTTCTVLAVVCAAISRRRGSSTWALVAGLWIGLAWNCKPPLGLFVLPVLAAALDRGTARARQVYRLSQVGIGFSVGLAAYFGYLWYRYPDGIELESMRYAPPMWGKEPLAGLAGLLLSPAAGMFFYCPTLLLSFRGLQQEWNSARWWTGSVLLSGLGFLLFMSCISFFKGDIAWGPRYLTPLFALLWLFVPTGVASLPAGRKPVALALGLLIQLLGLCTDPHRLYIEKEFPSGAFMYNPWVYFNPGISHLFHRPFEIWAILQNREPAETFTPAPSPTYALPLHEFLGGPSAVKKYHLFNSFRPWWANQQHLAPEERPVRLGPTVALFIGFLLAGLALMLGSGPALTRRAC